MFADKRVRYGCQSSIDDHNFIKCLDYLSVTRTHNQLFVIIRGTKYFWPVHTNFRSFHSLWLRIYFTSCDDWMHRSNAWRNDVRIFQAYGIAISCFLLLQKFICETVFNYLTNTLSWNSVWTDQRSYWTNRINEIKIYCSWGKPIWKNLYRKKIK